MAMVMMPLLYSVTGALVGYASHGHIEPELLAMTALVPVAWLFCDKRIEAVVFIFSYYVLAARGIPSGGAVFFGQDTPFLFSVLLWLASSVSLTLPWALLRPSAPYVFYKVFIRLLLVFVFITVPPNGLFGWASPLLAVGILFPGSGWIGILVFLIALSLLSAAKRKMRLPIYGIATAVIILIALQHQAPQSVPAGFIGIDTHYGKVASGSAGFTDAFIRTSDIAVRVLAEDAMYVLVPETVAGIWTNASEKFWSGLVNLLHQREQTLIVGAEIYDDAQKYDNCMLFLGFDSAVLYRQRVPVPVSMWMPFGGAGTANAYWFDSGVVELADGRRAAVLICYEQFLVWPVLRSFFCSAPDMLIATANQWWCKDTSIPNIQLQCAASWAKLFGVPLVTATNL